MRKIIYICSLIALFAMTTYAQSTTMTISQVNASVGEQISVPISVKDFFNIGAITIKIQYDSSVLNFDGIANAPSNMASGNTSSVISLSWASLTALNIADGKLLDLKFTYKSGSSDLTFLPQTVVANSDAIPISVTLNNGVVSGDPSQAIELKIDTVQAAGASVTVPINVKNFNEIGAITLKIAYDSAVLTFDGIENAPADMASGATNGIVSLSWASLTSLSIAEGKLVDLKFTYNGGQSNLTFNTAQCVVADKDAKQLTGISYVNGMVLADAANTVEIKIDTVQAAGASVTVPINVKNFNEIGAITLKIAYDSAVLTFDGIENAPADMASGATNGIVSLSWASLTSLSIAEGKLADLKFTYNGGQSNLTFNTAQCVVADKDAKQLTGIFYVNGMVLADAANTVEIKIDTVQAAGASVTVPINVKNFNEIGAITLKIAYDSAVLTFDGIENAPADMASGATNGIVSLSWASLTSLSIAEGKLADLKFTYNGGQSNLTFNTAQCVVADKDAKQLTGIFYVNGMVLADAANTVEIKIDTVQAAGASVTVPINVKNFNEIGAITLKIAYDSAVLTFDGIENAPANMASGATNGMISLSWASLTSLSIAEGKLADLKFTYNEGQSNLTFNTAQCVVADKDAKQLTGISYVNGAVNPQSGFPIITLSNVVQLSGNDVVVPIKVKDFNNISAITFKVQYDNAVLVFDGLENSPAGMVFGANNGILSLSWASLTPLTISDDTLLSIKFKFSNGTSPLNFLTDQCVLADKDA